MNWKMGNEVESMPFSKMSMKAVCPSSRAISWTKGTDNRDVGTWWLLGGFRRIETHKVWTGWFFFSDPQKCPPRAAPLFDVSYTWQIDRTFFHLWIAISGCDNPIVWHCLTMSNFFFFSGPTWGAGFPLEESTQSTTYIQYRMARWPNNSDILYN